MVAILRHTIFGVTVW